MRNNSENQGVICCTCGHLLVESESSQNFSHWRQDALSIPHYVKNAPMRLRSDFRAAVTIMNRLHRE